MIERKILARQLFSASLVFSEGFSVSSTSGRVCAAGHDLTGVYRSRLESVYSQQLPVTSVERKAKTGLDKRVVSVVDRSRSGAARFHFHGNAVINRDVLVVRCLTLRGPGMKRDRHVPS